MNDTPKPKPEKTKPSGFLISLQRAYNALPILAHWREPTPEQIAETNRRKAQLRAQLAGGLT